MRADEKVCPQCAETIKLDARVCKHCGHAFSDADIEDEKAKRRAGLNKRVGIAAAIVIGGGVLLAISGHNSSTAVRDGEGDNITAVDADAAANNATTAQAPRPPKAPESSWSYSEEEDKMRGGKQKIAQVTSTDTVHLSSPYSDTQPVLHIRRAPAFGFNIYFTSEGQPLCRPFMHGRVSIKFDNGSVQSWGCSEAESSTSGIVFLTSEKRLLAKIKAAKTMTIEDDYFDRGREVFSFPVAGLKW